MGEESFDLAPLRAAIIRRREGLGWSTGRLAARAGMADPHLRRIESGESKTLGLGTLQKLATALGITADELLEDAGIPTRQSHFAELDGLYGDLGPTERRAWIRMGRTLSEMRREYEAFQADVEDAQRPHAAYDREVPPLDGPATPDTEP